MPGGRPGPIHGFPQNVLFTLIAAFLSYWLIERPFLALKQHYTAVPPAALATWGQQPLPQT